MQELLAIFLKVGDYASEAAGNINSAFGKGATSERML